MTLVLCRVDERLIHGQVVVGWGMKLRPTHYIVVDDEIASSEWEQELYSLALPAETPAAFFTVEEGRRELPQIQSSEDRTVLLMRSLRTVVELARDGGLRGVEVNLGGMHAGPTRIQITPYLHLSDEDREAISSLEGSGVTLFAQDVPATPRHSIGDLLG